MPSNMQPRTVLAFLLAQVIAGAMPAESGSSTSPLTKHSVGTYSVTPWKSGLKSKYPESFYSRTKEFDFAIRSITYNSKSNLALMPAILEEINGELAAAEQLSPMKYMILRIDFWDDNERFRLTPGVQDLSVYRAKIDAILAKVNWKSRSFLGVSLSEENMPGTNGRFGILSGLYTYLHKKYPGLKVYQWLMPNVSVPIVKGFGLLPADGWIIDPYTLSAEMYPDARFHLGSDPYLTILRQYLDTGKPVISVVWASSSQPYNYNPSDPRNKSHIDQWQIMDHQFQINQFYNVPTVFYWMKASGGGGETPFFNADDPDPLLSRINQKVQGYISRAHSGR